MDCKSAVEGDCKNLGFLFLAQVFVGKPGLEIMAGQRTMSGLIVDLTGQIFVLPVMLTGQNSIVLWNFDMKSWSHATRAVVYNSRIETDIGIKIN